MPEAKKKKEGGEKTDSRSVLKKKITYLEEELIRKDKMIEKLKEENVLLLRTALKNSEKRLEYKQ
ncbi:MAG: hypothetical protein V1866_06760 [archaeon]